MVAVPEVTVRSAAPIPAVFPLAGLRVKRTVNSPKEAGVSEHYPAASLSFPPGHAAFLSLSVGLSFYFFGGGACESVETITTFLRRHVGLVGAGELSREFTRVALVYVIEEEVEDYVPVEMEIKIR